MAKYKVYVPEDSIEHMALFKVGDKVSVIYFNVNYSDYRIRTCQITNVTKTFVETDEGRRFSKKTGRELPSKVVPDVECSNIYLDELDYWDKEDDNKIRYQTLYFLWKELENAVKERRFTRIKELVVTLEST